MSTRAKKPGRPARLSRARVVKATLQLLDRLPAEQVTMARVARSLGTAPMSLYTHVRNRDDLFDATAALALERLDISVPADGSWEDQLRSWSRALRAHFRRYSNVLHVIQQHGRVALPWLRVRVVLVRILRRAGLDGTTLANAVSWVSQAVMGAIMLELMIPPALSAQGDAAAAFRDLDRLDADDRDELLALLPHMAEHDRDRFFEFGIDRIVASIRSLAS